MLQRSQGARLSVSIDVSTIKASVISEVFGQAHRLTQLTIRKVFDSPSWENLFVDWGSLHVPNLAKLCLHGSGSRSTSPLPETLFQGTVKLRHLEISGVDIKWNSYLFKSLTTLVLDHMSSRMPNWSQLRSMLQGIPGLQSLTMRQILPSITPETTFISCPIHLPSLKMLCLDEDATKLESFFRSVLFSDCLETSRCYISVEAQQTTANICDLLSLASRVSSGACLSARARFLAIKGTLYHSEPYKISLKTANCPLDPDLNVEAPAMWDEIDEIPGLKFEILEKTTRLRGGDIYNEIFTGIFRAFHFQNLLELDLSCHDIPSPVTMFRDILAATYGTLPMLYSVTVGCSTASLLIDILSIRSDKQDDCDATDESNFLSSDGLFDDSDEDSDEEFDLSPISPSSPIVFPALRTLRLDEVSFNRDEHNPCFVVKLDQLEKCLVSRSRHGVGILMLVLAYCENLHSEDVEQMEDLVPDVILCEIHEESKGD